jgi:hypothetical protein
VQDQLRAKAGGVQGQCPTDAIAGSGNQDDVVA